MDAAGVDWRGVQKSGWTWDCFAAEMKKINALRDRPAYAGRPIYGTLIQLWSDTLRNVLWTYGGDVFAAKPDGTPDFGKLALDTPGSQRGLGLIRRLRLVDRTAYNTTGIARDGGAEFVNGNIGCIGPIGHWKVPQYKLITAFKWDVVPVPTGTRAASAVFYNGWAMSAHSAHADASYDLLRYLCGRAGQVAMARAGAARRCGRCRGGRVR